MRTMGERLLNSRNVALGLTVALLASTFFLTVAAFWEWEGDARHHFADEYCYRQNHRLRPINLVNSGLRPRTEVTITTHPSFSPTAQKCLTGIQPTSFSCLTARFFGWGILPRPRLVDRCLRSGLQRHPDVRGSTKKQKEEMAIIPMLALTRNVLLMDGSGCPHLSRTWSRPELKLGACTCGSCGGSANPLAHARRCPLRNLMEVCWSVIVSTSRGLISEGRSKSCTPSCSCFLFGITHLLGR